MTAIIQQSEEVLNPGQALLFLPVYQARSSKIPPFSFSNILHQLSNFLGDLLFIFKEIFFELQLERAFSKALSSFKALLSHKSNSVSLFFLTITNYTISIHVQSPKENFSLENQRGFAKRRDDVRPYID